jgi:hypothetical protein
MGSFEQGWALGQRSVEAGVDAGIAKQRNRIADERTKIEDQRWQSADARNAVLAEAEQKRQARLSQEFGMEMQAKRDEMRRLTEADDAFNTWEKEVSALDQGALDFPTQYKNATTKALPTILKHPQVTAKWKAMDEATKQGQAFTIAKAAETDLLQMQKDIAGLGLTADFAMVKGLYDAKDPAYVQEAAKLRDSLAIAKAKREQESKDADTERTIRKTEELYQQRAGAETTKQEGMAKRQRDAAQAKVLVEELATVNQQITTAKRDFNPRAANPNDNAKARTKLVPLTQRKQELEFELKKLGGNSPQESAPVEPAKKLTVETAKQFLQQAGGDKAKAQEMARKAGFTW